MDQTGSTKSSGLLSLLLYFFVQLIKRVEVVWKGHASPNKSLHQLPGWSEPKERWVLNCWHVDGTLILKLENLLSHEVFDSWELWEQLSKVIVLRCKAILGGDRLLDLFLSHRGTHTFIAWSSLLLEGARQGSLTV